MDTNRLPKQALQYKPKGRRNIGRPRKRWRDQLHLEDQGTGNTPNPSGTWWWRWCILFTKFSSTRFGRHSGHFQVDALIQEYKNTNVVKQYQHHFIDINIIFDRSHPDVLWNINITKQYTSNISIYFTSWLHVSTPIGSSSGLLLNHVIKKLRTLLGSKLMFTKTLIGIPRKRRIKNFLCWVILPEFYTNIVLDAL